MRTRLIWRRYAHTGYHVYVFYGVYVAPAARWGTTNCKAALALPPNHDANDANVELIEEDHT